MFIFSGTLYVVVRVWLDMREGGAQEGPQGYDFALTFLLIWLGGLTDIVLFGPHR